jgi:dolichol-phosphate hexosyltransferase
MNVIENTITILIPSLNEENGIRETLASIPTSELHDLGYNVEIIVIDGNSTDSTRQIATRMGARVILETRKGYGRAYKTGFKAAKGDILITLDADGTYPAQNIPDYIRQLNESGVDFITINRFGKIENGAMSLVHKIGNKILSIAMRLLYSVEVKDSQSGMWLMRRSFVDRIKLYSNDMSMSEEIKIIAFKHFKCIEIDGRYFVRVGEPKLDTILHGWNNLKYLFQFAKRLELSVLPAQIDVERTQIIEDMPKLSE